MRKLFLLLLPLLPACAGSVSGEVDGDAVPAFGSAAFGLVEVGSAAAIFAVSFPGDSCANGAAFFEQADDANNEDDREKAAEDGADFINEHIPEGSWFAFITVTALDEDDLESDTVELDDPGDLIVQLQLCFQDDAAEADGEVLDAGQDCFRGVDGELEVQLDDEQTRFHIRAPDGEVELVDDQGDDAGEVGIDFNFSRCEDMDDALEDLGN